MIKAASSQQATTNNELQKVEIRLNCLLSPSGSLTLSVAESCTGGNVARRITSVPGSSDYFLGGVIAYANSAKERTLGVPRSILDTYGAVSAECAAAMSEGARRTLSSDVAVSTTGIAGPGGGASSKPVGLVYLAISTSTETTTERHLYQGSRSEIIETASERALELLLETTSNFLETLGSEQTTRSENA